MSSYLSDIAAGKNADNLKGIVSICSANGYALKASMKRALKYNVPVLIEATANQVDQNGGYTGMTPSGFVSYVQSLAAEVGFQVEKLILGGDHLGPLTRSGFAEDEAMEYAEELVYSYVAAGFTKIHLDTSMRLASDPVDRPLDVSAVAERGARLCRVAESAFAERLEDHPESERPVYVIGSEVPIPGGTQSAEETAEVTSPEDCGKTYEVYRSVFSENRLGEAFERVLAIVVQIGVEFGDHDIFIYNREAARELTDFGRDKLPVAFEGHSTDYQPEESLREMVEDGVVFLKVGPALTFMLREALFALEHIERELCTGVNQRLSNFSEVLENAMLSNPGYWKNHYHGNTETQRFARRYSFSDRARYYLNVPEVKKSIEVLIGNIDAADLPLSLMSQFLPFEFRKALISGERMSAEDLINEHIGLCLDDYYRAVLPGLH